MGEQLALYIYQTKKIVTWGYAKMGPEFIHTLSVKQLSTIESLIEAVRF